PALGVYGQALEDVVEVPRLLTRGDCGAIDLREDPRELAESVGQGVAFHDLRADPDDDALHPRLLGLLRDREQRFLERQAGPHQGGELTGEEREIGGRDAADEAERA